MTKEAPPPRVVVTTPKQLNYDAYFDYFVTTYTASPTRPAVNADADLVTGKVSQFLQSLDDGTGLDTGINAPHHANIESFEPVTIYLNGADKSTHNGFTLIGASFQSTPQSGLRNYAGLLEGADVGRFTDALTGTTAQWSGGFYSSAYVSGTSAASRTPVRFPITLTVNFELGAIGTNGVLELLAGHSVNIEGTFGFAKGDANQGIIEGEIFYTAPNTNEQRQITRAPLYGIIGNAGALAVFAGGGYRADGTGGDSPLIGGFEVSPNPVPTVGYQIFVDYTSNRPRLGANPNGLQIFNTVTKSATLLAGTRTGLVQTGIDDTTTCNDADETGVNDCIKRVGYQTIRLGEDERSNSGFAIMTTNTASEGRGYSYGGLLSGTNLGAVLPVRFATGNTTAVWHGSIYHTAERVPLPNVPAGFVNLVHAPLSLTVDLAAGTLRTVNLLGNLGAVALSATSSVEIDGRFGLNPSTAKQTHGLLLGTVKLNTLDYALVGLIGADGAIGIFRFSGYFGTHVTIGGFQVSPPPPPAYGRAEYAVFEDFYTKRPEADDRYLEASRTDDTDQFVRGLRIGLVAPADGTLTAGFAPLTVFLGGDVNSGNAFVLENFNGTHVAGLLGTTDLGFAPHAGLASAIWDGTFYVSNNVESTGTDAPAPFEIKAGLIVDFAAGTLTSGKIVDGTITSSQATYTLANNEFISFGIYGEFGRVHELPLGILDGFVKYGHHATDESSIVTKDLPLIGVIGRQGALGIFRDPDNNLVGGFQVADSATPRVFSGIHALAISDGFDPTLNEFGGNNSIGIVRAYFLRPNAAGTGLIAKNLATNANIPSFLKNAGEAEETEAGTRYGLGGDIDDTDNLNGFILAGGNITTAPSNGQQTATPTRVVGVGLLPTTNMGGVILDVAGSATWTGRAYVLDIADADTKIFELKFSLNFATW